VGRTITACLQQPLVYDRGHVGDAPDREGSQRPVEAALEVSQAILEGLPPRRLFLLIARKAMSVVEASLVAVATPSEDGRGLAVRVAIGRRAGDLQGWTIPVDDQTRPVLQGREPSRVELHEGVWPAHLPPGLGERVGPALLAPLVAHEKPVGLLLMANAPSGATFSEHDKTLVQLFASQAAVAIDYSRARSAMQRVALIEDRERIARELHDGVVQALFGVGLNLQAATTMAEDPGLRQRLEEAIHKIDEVVQDLRNYVFELRPSVLADRRLDQAIRRVAADFADRSHVAIEIDVDEQVAAALSSRAEHLLQLTSEGLSNVVRHADASHCRLSLRREGDLAVLEVVDDGRGFDPGSEVDSGHGLRNFRERAAEVGADVEIDAAPERGTRLAVRLAI
jgi:signal transduction histidine kinase